MNSSCDINDFQKLKGRRSNIKTYDDIDFSIQVKFINPAIKKQFQIEDDRDMNNYS